MNTLINTIIVDDEVSCIKKLCKDLAVYPDIHIIETTSCTEKAKKVILQQQPSLLFLDVEMSNINGIELLNEIRSSIHSHLSVVFYSAFEKYMVDVLRASAFDCLSKSYKEDDLKLIINRIRQKLKIKKVNLEQSIRHLLADDRKFALHTISDLLLLRRSEILSFQYINDQRYWQMTLTNLGTHKLRQSTTAKDILNISNSFFQISQDCIFNIDYLASIENKTLRCTLYPPFNNMNVFVSRRYYSKIKEVLEII